MNQFLPFQHVKGPIGFSNQVRNQGSTIIEGLSAVEDPSSNELLMPSFSAVLQQVEDPKLEAVPKKQVMLDTTDQEQALEKMEQALHPFMDTDANELAELLEPESLTTIILQMLSIPQDDQKLDSQGALQKPAENSATSSESTVPTSKSVQSDLILTKSLDGMTNEKSAIVVNPTHANAVPTAMDETMFSLGETQPLNVEADSLNISTKPESFLLDTPKVTESLTVAPSMLTGDKSESLDLVRNEKETLTSNKVLPFINRIPVSIQQAYWAQEQQGASQLVDQEGQLEHVLAVANELSKTMTKQGVRLDPEIVQQVTNKVETFFNQKDQTTLQQLLSSLKESIPAFGNHSLETDLNDTIHSKQSVSQGVGLESSKELEKLLLQVKGIELHSKPLEVENASKPVDVSEEREPRNKSIAQAVTTSSSETKQSISNERSSSSEGKQSITNDVSISSDKTILAVEKNTQQPEVLKAEGQAEERRFVKTLQRILHQGTLTQRSDGQTSFTLKLFPEHLGKLQIQVIQSGQKLAAQIIAESSSTRDLVERSLPQLRQALLSQNVTFDQIDVDEFHSNNQHEQQQQEQSEENDQQEREQESRSESRFSFKSLLEGLFS